MFAILAKVVLAFVIIPISNAASEWAFSMVRKCALLSTKMNSDIRPSLSVLHVQVPRAAKRATLEYNIAHNADK